MCYHMDLRIMPERLYALYIICSFYCSIFNNDMNNYIGHLYVYMHKEIRLNMLNRICK